VTLLLLLLLLQMDFIIIDHVHGKRLDTHKSMELAFTVWAVGSCVAGLSDAFISTVAYSQAASIGQRYTHVSVRGGDYQVNSSFVDISAGTLVYDQACPGCWLCVLHGSRSAAGSQGPVMAASQTGIHHHCCCCRCCIDCCCRRLWVAVPRQVL
jgi:hypothetical protein